MKMRRRKITINKILAWEPAAFSEVLIIGRPGSGKTSLGDDLAEAWGSEVIATDDYIDCKTHLVDLEKLLDSSTPGDGDIPRIIEGAGGYRLLRRGHNERDYFPEIVINLVAPTSVLKARKIDPRKHRAQHRANLTILKEYLHQVPADQAPVWYDVIIRADG